mmetsp:Transcript_13787/g.40323  ORF Transcript_13787/g.40323 Transcript_13787/m.40323 type:complete len:235 (-) Transcript_13787:1068-1772(-)
MQLASRKHHGSPGRVPMPAKFGGLREVATPQHSPHVQEQILLVRSIFIVQFRPTTSPARPVWVEGNRTGSCSSAQLPPQGLAPESRLVVLDGFHPKFVSRAAVAVLQPHAHDAPAEQVRLEAVLSVHHSRFLGHLVALDHLKVCALSRVQGRRSREGDPSLVHRELQEKGVVVQVVKDLPGRKLLPQLSGPGFVHRLSGLVATGASEHAGTPCPSDSLLASFFEAMKALFSTCL